MHSDIIMNIISLIRLKKKRINVHVRVAVVEKLNNNFAHHLHHLQTKNHTNVPTSSVLSFSSTLQNKIKNKKADFPFFSLFFLLFLSKLLFLLFDLFSVQSLLVSHSSFFLLFVEKFLPSTIAHYESKENKQKKKKRS